MVKYEVGDTVTFKGQKATIVMASESCDTIGINFFKDEPIDSYKKIINSIVYDKFYWVSASDRMLKLIEKSCNPIKTIKHSKVIAKMKQLDAQFKKNQKLKAEIRELGLLFGNTSAATSSSDNSF